MSDGKAITIVCLIALPEEFETFREVFPKKADQSFDETIALEHESPADGLQLISVLAEQMGSESAAQSAHISLDKFDPDIVVVLGIAGGISKDADLGDVVVSNQVLDVLHNSKVVENGKGFDVDFAPNFYDIDAELISAFTFFSIHPNYESDYQDWRLVAGCDLEHAFDTKTDRQFPRLLVGPIACGPVSTSEAFNAKLKKIHRKVAAIETESGGVFAVLSKRRVPAIAVRGISDLADAAKAGLEAKTDGEVRKAAMLNAANLVKLVAKTSRFQAVGLRQKSHSNADEQEELFNEVAPNPSVIHVLENLIKERLSEVSIEFRNQPEGFYLPTPRVRRLVFDDDFESTELADPENLIDTFVENDRVFVHLPRTFPTQALGWSLAYSLIKQPLDNALVLPVHVDIDEIKPPSGKLINSIPEEIRAPAMGPEFTQIFIIENMNFGSRTRVKHLLGEIGKAGGKVLILSRSEGSVAEVESFVREGNFVEFEMAPISFSETAFFLEKTFDMSPQEAEVIAIRLDDTFRKFRLDAHPTYFAGLHEETLAALIDANKRAELIQLAVDGLLSLIVAADKAKLKLSRSTRERFLRKVVLDKQFNGSIKEVALIDLAAEFLKEFKFEVSAIDFVQPFLTSGMIHFVDDSLRFSHPYLESYLLAQGLRDDSARAREYFKPTDDFNYYAFDLYCEIGPDSEVIDAVREYIRETKESAASICGQEHVFLEKNRKLLSLSNEGQLNSYHRGLKAQSKRLFDDNSDLREEKQQILDARRQVRSEVNERQPVRRDKMPKEIKAEFDALDALSRSLLLSATIVGSGSESLTGQVKQGLAEDVVEIGVQFSDLWTRNRARVDFEELRGEMLNDAKLWDFFEANEIDGAKFEGFKREIELSIYGAELNNVLEPMSRILWRICSLAGVKVLKPVIEEVVAKDSIGELIVAAWLHDVDPKAGKLALKGAIGRYKGAPAVRLVIASHLLWRVFWHHHKTAGSPHFLASVDRMLLPLGLQPSQKRLEHAKKGAGDGA